MPSMCASLRAEKLNLEPNVYKDNFFETQEMDLYALSPKRVL